MKICIISPLFDPWLVGGREKYVKTLVDELSTKHQVVVITSRGPTSRKKNQSGSNPKIIEIRPLNISTLYDITRDNLSSGLTKKLLWHFLDLWNISSYLQIKKILKIEKPDLIHTNGIMGLSPSLFSVIKHLRIAHVHSIHDYELISPWVVLFRNGKSISRFNFLDRIFIFYMRQMSSHIDSVISPSRFTMDFHEKLGFFKNSHKYVIPNGIKLDNAKPKEGHGTEFLFIGQIIESKGPHIAVKAFKKVAEKDAKLHIVGRGPYLDTLKQMTKDDERIILHGFVDDEHLDEIFNKCSYALIPSLWYEVFGLVINEAMSKGLPMIASNIGGIPELVKDGQNGFLFQPGDVDCLYHILETLTNDKEILSKLSKNAIESSKKFPIENQMKSIMKVYAKTVSG
ncbi:MAG: hypothetical protein AUH25_04265 [Thaumarchaeota archaeon 13_1_40CM_38_12]|nr:MAG: hypothetical protein AUH25_04265 [Thaumarchaeota archaeon 13_1_40CM_38_12]OLC36039.1 MAG: hypothetical protein AUH84_02200 [Thaumarchaeota archaeon 13_1_40CM_4_38_7]OLC92255.1 MAG: hypothetical protein AUI92_05590 [Thaumarchaeota archaeon 13_1_40CM_3_38_6]